MGAIARASQVNEEPSRLRSGSDAPLPGVPAAGPLTNLKLNTVGHVGRVEEPVALLVVVDKVLPVRGGMEVVRVEARLGRDWGATGARNTLRKSAALLAAAAHVPYTSFTGEFLPWRWQ